MEDVRHKDMLEMLRIAAYIPYAVAPKKKGTTNKPIHILIPFTSDKPKNPKDILISRETWDKIKEVDAKEKAAQKLLTDGKESR